MEAELDRERLTWMYRQMLRIREFEERVITCSRWRRARSPKGSTWSRSARPTCGGPGTT